MNASVSQALHGSQSPVTVAPPAAGHAPSASVAAAGATAEQPAAAAPQPQPSSEQVQKAVENLRRTVAPLANDLQFSVDEGTGTTVIKVVDSSTKEVIRQIPSEEVLSLAKDLDQLQGLLLKNKA